MRIHASWLVAAAALACQGSATAQQARGCRADNVGLTLPAGFCAGLVVEGAGRVRHLAVAANGDVIVSVQGRTGGGVLVLRDTDGDGTADVRRRFGPGSGGGLALANGYLYFGLNDAVVRWAWPDGQLEPSGPPDTIVSGLIAREFHFEKNIVVSRDGRLFVNIGAPSNACQLRDRVPGVPGADPCTLLDSAGGIWVFDANRSGQRQADGRRYATGLRNVVALTIDARTQQLWGAQHGRDDLARLWPGLFTDPEEANAEKPAEELFRITDGGNYGWPYCYYDLELGRKVLSPEYGGDGQAVGRCASMGQPVAAFPAHWAPNASLVYRGTSFPASYRGGMFLAFHGSWNRAPRPQQGYNVVFQPLNTRGAAAGPYTVFADGFRSGSSTSRPTGLAVGPDGSLYVSDDGNGRIYRIRYVGR